MSESSPFTVAVSRPLELGEGPVWSQRERALYWVDITAPALNRLDPASGGHSVIPMPEDVGCVGLVRGGGFVAGFRSGLCVLDGEGRPLRKLADNPEDISRSRLNDGRVDPRGGFWVGTIDQSGGTGGAHLYRYDQRGLASVLGGITISNGLAFSPDGRWLYHTDTPRYAINRYPFDRTTGEIGACEPWVKLVPSATDKGRPDGASVDRDGHYWVALYEGARIQRYSPEGRLVAEHPVPAKCPTMAAFGGDDLRTLYVTSARHERPADELDEWPLSGCLFSMRVDTPGLPEPEFVF